MEDADPRLATAEDFTAELERRPELAAGLRKGSVDALIEYFQLGGARIESYTVRYLK